MNNKKEYKNLTGRIWHRKPAEDVNNRIAFDDIEAPDYKAIRFGAKGFLLDDNNNIIYNKPVTLTEALQAFAILVLTIPRLHFKPLNRSYNINLLKVWDRIIQRAIPGFKFSNKELRSLDPNSIVLNLANSKHDNRNISYNVYSSGLHIGRIMLDTKQGGVAVDSLLSYNSIVIMQDKSVIENKYILSGSPLEKKIVNLFKREIQEAKKTVSRTPVLSDNARKAVEEAVDREVNDENER